MTCARCTPGFDASRLTQYIKRLESCKKVLMENDEDGLGKKYFLREGLKTESASFSCSKAFHRKKTFTVLPMHMFSCRSGPSHFGSAHVPLEVAHPVSKEHSQLIERTIRKK